MAIFGSKPKIRVSEGTKRVPPPTPSIDARIPIKNAIVNPRRYSSRMLYPSFFSAYCLMYCYTHLSLWLILIITFLLGLFILFLISLKKQDDAPAFIPSSDKKKSSARTSFSDCLSKAVYAHANSPFFRHLSDHSVNRKK